MKLFMTVFLLSALMFLCSDMMITVHEHIIIFASHEREDGSGANHYPASHCSVSLYNAYDAQNEHRGLK